MEVKRNFRAVRWISKLSAFGFMGGGIAAIAVSGMVYGIQIDRRLPKIYNLQILGETHAGGNAAIVETINVPPNCIPRFMRSLVKDRDLVKNTKTQVITDVSVVAHGIIEIPLPRDTDPGDWFYEEKISTAGCGVLSGFLPPMVADAHDPQGHIGVPIHILPFESIPSR